MWEMLKVWIHFGLTVYVIFTVNTMQSYFYIYYSFSVPGHYKLQKNLNIV